ncbi:hypothetical protein STP4a_081 [Salmonella phage STP4-a]|uniref:Thioredoxin n=1 Tax=Salmonella phage STP4-a TaxID=1445860 RepID=A0A0B4L9G8_9CAUD|nr:hypothetical protein STP4a_081 [Salmonella phage STP4-a]AHJ86936.1 hypothetical protein STP4a_081 [Salmonella phage STP4-a]UFK27207.1 hypothetical protein LG358_00186 [Escherichia phage UoN_LG358_1]
MRNQLKEDLVQDEEDFEIDWTTVLEMADRRERSMKQVTPCPKCETNQVQLVDWHTEVLKMKCRKCKHKFTKVLNETN